MLKPSSFLLLALSCHLASSTQVFCYFTNWAIYRDGIANFQTSDIDSSLCTVILYSFFGVDETTGNLTVLDSESDFDLGNIEGVVALKENNTDLKVLASMGGWNQGSERYSIVAGNATSRANFVNSVLDFIQRYGFDGFDLDWEYPTARNGSAADYDNFITLLSEVKATLETYGYLLTVAVAGASENVPIYYNVAALSNVVDYINLMVYDLRSASSVNYTAHHAPLYPSELDTSNETALLSVYGGVNQWLDLGANASKLVVGLPFYARSFELCDANDTGLYACSTGSAPAGPLTAEAGFYSYQEICYYFSNYTYVWNEAQQAPHAYENLTWFGFDNPASIKAKTLFALESGLAGLMVWDMDYDDFNGSCGNGTYPLLKTVNGAIADYNAK